MAFAFAFFGGTPNPKTKDIRTPIVSDAEREKHLDAASEVFRSYLHGRLDAPTAADLIVGCLERDSTGRLQEMVAHFPGDRTQQGAAFMLLWLDAFEKAKVSPQEDKDLAASARSRAVRELSVIITPK